MIGADIENLIRLVSRLPGLGARSARRCVLHLLKNRETLMLPLAQGLDRAAETIVECHTCHNLDTTNPCTICTDTRRDQTSLCVVEDISDLWAVEKTGSFRGYYHVLGGTLSALDGITPEDLSIPQLVTRANNTEITEVILALNATIDGQTTAHYIAECLENCNVSISQLAHGVPIGGQIDYLDDGTLQAALRARKAI
ncbi:MAG: recombination mediator RecR [Alphaproteobacteria bacterium]|nr:recombination mediator RecR [Alphaproteobacteria bacterium]